MRKETIEFLIEEKERLINGEIRYIDIGGVYPASLEKIFGEFQLPLEMNGWECDYWGETEKGFYVSSSMYYGNATIRLINQ